MSYGKLLVDEIEDSTGDVVDMKAMVSTEATGSKKGFMSAADKAKLDSISDDAFSTADKTKLDGIEAGAEVNTVASVAGKTGAVSLTSADVSGLQDALDAKADTSALAAKADVTALDAKADTTALDAKADATALADKLDATASFGGDVSGTYDAIVIADDSHNHVISNVDGLQDALDDKADASALAGKAEASALTGKLDTTASFGGDVSGTYDAIVIADDSHNHVISNIDGLQDALDDKADASALAGKADVSALASKADTSDLSDKLTTSTQFGGDVSGSYNNIVVADDSHNHIVANIDGLGTLLNQKAEITDLDDKLTTSTTFSGDVSGSYNSLTVADDSHNHVISNVDGLQSALDAKANNSSLSSMLTTSTNFGGDVSGTYSNIVVADNSHSHTISNITNLLGALCPTEVITPPGTSSYKYKTDLTNGSGFITLSEATFTTSHSGTLYLEWHFGDIHIDADWYGFRRVSSSGYVTTGSSQRRTLIAGGYQEWNSGASTQNTMTLPMVPHLFGSVSQNTTVTLKWEIYCNQFLDNDNMNPWIRTRGNSDSQTRLCKVHYLQ